MLPYLTLLIIPIAVFILYKYYRFKRGHICTTNDSLSKFFKFWIRRLSQNPNWKNFVNGEGTFQYKTNTLTESESTYGGGISGSW